MLHFPVIPWLPVRIILISIMEDQIKSRLFCIKALNNFGKHHSTEMICLFRSLWNGFNYPVCGLDFYGKRLYPALVV